MPWVLVKTTSVDPEDNTFVGSLTQQNQLFLARVAGFSSLDVRRFGTLSNVYNAPIPSGAIATTRQQWQLWRPTQQLFLDPRYSAGDMYLWVPKSFGSNLIFTLYRFDN